jgi:hypothetical protein
MTSAHMPVLKAEDSSHVLRTKFNELTSDLAHSIDHLAG